MPCWPACRDSNWTWISPMMSPVPFGSGVDLAGEAGQGLGLGALLGAVGAVRRHQRLLHLPKSVVDPSGLLLERVVDLDEGARGLAPPPAHHRLDLGAQVVDVPLDLVGGLVDLGGTLRHGLLAGRVLSHGGPFRLVWSRRDVAGLHVILPCARKHTKSDRSTPSERLPDRRVFTRRPPARRVPVQLPVGRRAATGSRAGPVGTSSSTAAG